MTLAHRFHANFGHVLTVANRRHTEVRVTRRMSGQVPDDLELLLTALDSGWSIVDEHHLSRELTFADFKSALAFVNRVGHLAECENHHPNLFLGYGKVVLIVYTHEIDGLSEADFILAAKLDRLPR